MRSTLCERELSSRWISRDPLAEQGGLNLYEYVSNNPINLVDPLGETAWTIGPIAIPIPFTEHPPGEDVHEAQHRADFWNGNVFTMPNWELEQRAFKAQSDYIECKLADATDPQERQKLFDTLQGTEGFSTPDGAKQYQNYVNETFFPWRSHIPTSADPVPQPPAPLLGILTSGGNSSMFPQ